MSRLIQTFRDMNIGRKILILLLAVGLIPLATVSWFAYVGAQGALNETAVAFESNLTSQQLERLEVIRESKAKQITDYFELIHDQVVTFSEDRMVIDAMRSFTREFETYRARAGIDESRLTQMRREVAAYWRDEFGREYAKQNGGSSPQEIDRKIADMDADSIALQHAYIVSNPNPLGSKENLATGYESTPYDRTHGVVHPSIRSFLDHFHYYDIFLVDSRSGDIVYSVFKELDYGTSLNSGPWSDSNFGRAFREANRLGDPNQVVLVDFEQYTPSYEAPASFIATPIFDGDERLGVAIFQMPLDEITRVMSARTGLGETGDVFLVGSDGLMRSDSMRDPENHSVVNSFRHPERGGADTESVRRAIEKNQGTMVTTNYLGAEVFSAYQPVEFDGLRWAIVAEIEKEEALAPLVEVRSETAALARSLLLVSLLLAAGFAVGVAMISLVFSRWISKPIGQIMEGTQRLASGDFATEMSSEASDEFGNLINALDATREGMRSGLGADSVDWNALGDDFKQVSRLRACIEGMPFNVMTVNSDFELVYMNPAAEEALKQLQQHLPVRAENLLGTCIDVFHADASVQRDILMDPARMPYLAKFSIGEEILNLTATSAFDEDGNFVGASAAWEIVTEEEKAQEEASMLADVLATVASGAIPEPIEAEVGENLIPMRERLNQLIAAMKSITRTTSLLGEGDFTVDIDVRSDEDILLTEMRAMVENLGGVLAGIRGASAEVSRGTSEVSSTGKHLSDNASRSAASLEEISSTMEQMAGQTRQNAENANQAVSISSAARASAESGDEQMRSMVSAMREIDESSQDISKIIKVIDEIAFQTNLLALNAAVEAARAGVHGKGFAVVAEEVRNLAERSAQAAKETTELIEGSGKKVAQGRSIAEKTAESLVQIVEAIGEATDLVSEIAAASQEQAEGISQVNIGLTQVDRVTQANTASAEELAAAADSLRSRAAEVEASLSRFNLPGASVSSMPAETVAAPAPPAHVPMGVESGGGWEQLSGQVEQSRAETDGAVGDPREAIVLDDDEFGRY